MATLQRKVFHSEEHDESNSDKVFDALCKIDKHSKATGKTSYVASNPAGEARKANVIFSGVLGEPTPWPSAEELAAGMKASLERLKQFGRRSATRKEQDLADNGEEECEEDCAEHGVEEDPEAGDESEVECELEEDWPESVVVRAEPKDVDGNGQAGGAEVFWINRVWCGRSGVSTPSAVQQCMEVRKGADAMEESEEEADAEGATLARVKQEAAKASEENVLAEAEGHRRAAEEQGCDAGVIAGGAELLRVENRLSPLERDQIL